MRDIDQFTWIPGFVFGDDIEASCRATNGVCNLLLNPVKGNGKMKYHLRNRKDWCQMISKACHEVAHTLCSPHDEIYANVLTDLNSVVMYYRADIFRRIKAILEKNEQKSCFI